MDAKPTKIPRSPLSRTFRYASQSSSAPWAGLIRPATMSPAVRLARCHCALSASGRSMPSSSRATRNRSASLGRRPATVRREYEERDYRGPGRAPRSRSRADLRKPGFRPPSARRLPPAGLPQSRAQPRYACLLTRFVCDTVHVERRPTRMPLRPNIWPLTVRATRPPQPVATLFRVVVRRLEPHLDTIFITRNARPRRTEARAQSWADAAGGVLVRIRLNRGARAGSNHWSRGRRAPHGRGASFQACRSVALSDRVAPVVVEGGSRQAWEQDLINADLVVVAASWRLPS